MMGNGVVKRVLKGLFSLRLSVVLLVLVALILAIATFVEHCFSTAVARMCLYHHPLFFGLLAVLAVNMVGATVMNGFVRRQKWGMLLFHLGFLFVLLGALITHVWSYEGVLHLRSGEGSDQIVERVRVDDSEELRMRELPFRVVLDRFRVSRYPGSDAPSSYESDLTIVADQSERRVTLSVNGVVYEQGFRLYQSSFDADERGSVITVNYDPAGTLVSYMGYLLFAVGVLAILLGKGSRFRSLVGELNRISIGKSVVVWVLFLCVAHGVSAAGSLHEVRRYVPSEEVAESFSRLLVLSPSGRIEPVDTYSDQLLRKMTRSDGFAGLLPEQVLLGILLYPDYWAEVPFLSVGHEGVRALLGSSGDWVSFHNLFDHEGRYRLAESVESAYSKEAKLRNSLEKELLKLDERANLFFALQQGENLRLFPLPGDSAHRWYSPGDDLSLFVGQDSVFVNRIFSWLLQEIHQSGDGAGDEVALEVIKMIDTYQQKQAGEPLISRSRVEWELRYNRWQLFDRLSMIFLTLSLLMLLVSTARMMRQMVWVDWLSKGIVVLIALFWGVLTFGLGLRAYCSGHSLGANAYETMVLLSWAAVLCGLFAARRSGFVVGLATLLSGFVLLVAHLNFKDPAITPLIPVLQSGWLMAHVASIMSSYGLFGLSFLIGLLSLVLMGCNQGGRLSTQIHTLRLINELSVTVGVCLLTIGTFLGAVWANESWGRYWGWDPKETWALVTMLVYALVLHARFVRRLRSDFAFALLTVFALGSVLMTYFGVNYFLSGLHSYGGA